MGSYHRGALLSSQGLVYPHRSYVCCTSSPLVCSLDWRGKSAGSTWTNRIGKTRVISGNCLRLPYIADSSWQLSLHGVWDSGKSKKRRNLEVKAEGENKKAEGNNFEYYNALMRGGEEVIQMMKTMTELLEDIAGIDSDDEKAAVRMAVAAAVGQKLDKLEGNFMMALDWMIQQAEKEKDDKKEELLELIKETVLAQLSNQFPPQVQVVSALCTTPCKDARQEILRRCAGGGGTFQTVNGGEIVLPGANLNDVANQADDIVSEMEEKPLSSDRRLLAKLLLVREEARSLLSGGILDERNDNKGFKRLPEIEVSFLSKVVALKPGPSLRERLAKVMRGKDEGEEKAYGGADNQPRRRRRLINVGHDANAMVQQTNEESSRPVRPGIFLETLTKLLAGMYESDTAVGVTVQHLEWVHRVTLDILQEIAYS